MGRKRIIVVLVMLMAFGVSTTSGIASAARPSSDGTLSPTRSSITETCSGLLFAEAPDGVHCPRHIASADEASRVLRVDSAASSATEADPTGLLTSGQGMAYTAGRLSYEGRLKGSASKVTVTVQVSDIITEVSSNSATARGMVYLYAQAWPNMSFSEGADEAVFLASSSPLVGTPSLEDAGGTRTIVLVLDAVRMKSSINIRVGLVGHSSVGYVTCSEIDENNRCVGDLEAHDGAGISSAAGSLKVTSVKMETAP